MPPPTRSLCWPDDPDYLDGRTEINLDYYQTRAYWDTDILDVNGVRPGRIISVDDDFQVRFRLELVGTLWQCVAGDWNFDVSFDAQGAAYPNFDLSDKIPVDQLQVPNWRGCDTQCIELYVNVPAGTVPAGTRTGTVYELTGKFQISCCGKGGAVVGYEAKEEYQFYKP
jgi:hypothetical protein